VRLETDCLVIGAGVTGLAFTDTLAAEADVEVVLVERRGAVGGHWRDAYPFVRLHIPSAYYGADSLPLGEDWVDGGRERGVLRAGDAARRCARTSPRRRST
jgi:cation diffusion facilitator CzcD-associated flavoprotein CzcO